MTVFLFDFDSTLVDLESLDFAAERALSSLDDREARVAEIDALTKAGMEGEMDYGESLSRRIALARLTRDVTREAAQDIAERVDPGMMGLFAALRDGGAGVYIVSGGLRPLLEPAAARLDIGPGGIFCNEPVWKGELIAGVDRDVPLSRSGGKAEIARRVKTRAPERRLIMVGDGATDLEARAPGAADFMIGYGGVAARDAVRRGADIFAESAETLAEACRGQL